MSSALYWLIVRLYAFATRVAAPFHAKAKLAVQGRRDLLRNIRYALIDERRPRIWMHCASLGEFEQGRPLLEKLKEKYPHYAFVLTFFSPSGYEVRKNYEGADYIFYLPFDSVYNAKRFLDAVQPKFAVFVKYELWYFYLSQMARRDIPAFSSPLSLEGTRYSLNGMAGCTAGCCFAFGTYLCRMKHLFNCYEKLESTL